MASFTDKAPVFNPYVQQVPVETMAMVGMQKQQQYDTNVQRISEQIEKVAGLDIVRDIDKTYLQSKLNELGNNLRTFAASDFSNYQLTNNVTGMVSNVAKDKYVLNAVNSTARYRKALEKKEKLTSEGKGSASRDWLFGMETSDWLNSSELNKSFNGDYKPYKDYSKSAQEIVKGLAKDFTENDVYLDEDGNLMDAMTRTKIEGITPEKIQTALKAGLSPDDWEQLQVDGRYKYSNVDDATFLENIETRYTSVLTEQEGKLKELMRLQEIAPSVKEKQRIQERIDSVNDAIKNSKRDYENTISAIDSGNIESAKASLFTNQWMMNFSNAFSSKSVSQTLLDNPAAQMRMRKDEFKHKQAIDWANYGLKKEELQWKKEQKNKEDKENPQDPYGSLTLGVPKEVTAMTNEELLESKKLEIKLIGDEIVDLKQTALAFYDTSDKNAVKNMEDDYQRYKNNPSSMVNHKAVGIFESMLQKEKQERAETLYMGTLLQSAQELYPIDYDSLGVNEVRDPKTGERLAQKQFSLEYDGEQFTYNYIDSLEKIREFEKIRNSLGKDAESIRQNQKYVEELSPRDRALYNNYNKGLYNTGEAYTINTNIRKLYSTINDGLYEIEKQQNEFIGKELRKTKEIDARQTFALDLVNDETRSEFISSIIVPLNKLAKEQGSLPDFEKEDKNNLLKNTTKIKTATVTTNGIDKHSVIVSITDGSQIEVPIPTKQFNELFKDKYKLSPNTTYFNENILPKLLQTPRPVNVYEETLDPNMFESAQDAINKGYTLSPSGQYTKKVVSRPREAFFTTALDGRPDTNFENAWFKGKEDFPNTSYYRISANIITTQDPLETDEFTLDLNFEEPLGFGEKRKKIENYTFPVKVKKTQIKQLLRNFDDQTIFEILNGRKPSNSDLEALKEAAEKIPLN